jgi:hypothetical protein
MNREELIQLRDAIDMALALPDSVRELLVKWLAPEKPNGHDPHPPAASPPPRQAKRKPNAFAAKTAERKLIEAMRDNPSMSVVGLANAAGSSRSAAGERLRQMALRGSRISRTIGSSASERAFQASQSPFVLRQTRLTTSLPTAINEAWDAVCALA